MTDAAARREARRKRILENSESRLRVISGLVKAEDTLDPGFLPSLKIDDRVSDYIPQNSPEVFETPSISSSSSASSPEKEKQPHGFSGSSNDPFTPESLQQTEGSHSLISTVFDTQIHLLGLAILVRIILSTSQGYWIGESVFVPIFTLHLLKYCGFSFRLDSQNNGGGGIINAVLLLSGLPPQQISRFLKIMGGLKEIMEDFYIYFFSFIMFHVFLELITR